MARLKVQAANPPGVAPYTAQEALEGLAAMFPLVGPLRPRPGGREALQTLEGPAGPGPIQSRVLTVAWRLDVEGRVTGALSAVLERLDGEVEWRLLPQDRAARRLLGETVQAVAERDGPGARLSRMELQVEGVRGADTLEGGRRDDAISGGRGDDAIHASLGRDRATGGPGEDRLDFARLGEAQRLGPRDDGLRVDVGEGLARLPGAARTVFEGIEVLALTDARDRLRDDDAGRLVLLEGGADRARMGGGDDTAVGGRGADRLLGEGGHDQLVGLNGRDRLLGGGGDDTLSGEGGADRLLGGEGDDILRGGPGPDRLLGGAGDDTLSGAGRADELIGGRGRDALDGGDRADLLRGGAGADTLVGWRGDDVLEGGDGPDRLDGGQGDDVLDGGWGDDVLDAGRGADRLTGGPGADLFRFEERGEALDFVPGQDRAALVGAAFAELVFLDVEGGALVQAPEGGPSALFHGLSAAELDDPANFEPF